MHIDTFFHTSIFHTNIFFPTYAELKLAFSSLEIDSEEGEVVQVCTIMGGRNWLFLERQLTLVLDTDDGGEDAVMSKRTSIIANVKISH